MKSIMVMYYMVEMGVSGVSCVMCSNSYMRGMKTVG